ncbi:MAG: hypothetical protein M3354_12075 [Chloroflexota bacterium]|nr:hypothetical protein [Chloroflexota bacterium]
MTMTVVVHLHGEDAFVAEVDDVPDPAHAYVLLRNARRKDGKELPYITNGATAFLFPWHRITFLEMMGEVGRRPTSEVTEPESSSILGFFRERDNRNAPR